MFYLGVGPCDLFQSSQSIYQYSFVTRYGECLRQCGGCDYKVYYREAKLAFFVTQREREADRQIVRQTNRQADRQTDGQRDRQTVRHVDRERQRQTGRQTDKQRDK